MRLHEIANIISKGNKTNLSGGDLPNAYTDDANRASKTPRKKKKDVYGTGGGIGINSSGNNDGSTGDAAASGSSSGADGGGV